MQHVEFKSLDLFDEGRHHRAKIGFVLLATEQTIEDDMMALMPAGVGTHVTRVGNPDSITVNALTSIGEAFFRHELPFDRSSMTPSGSTRGMATPWQPSFPRSRR